MKAITMKLASGAMTALAEMENNHIYQPIHSSILEWYVRTHESNVDMRYREEMMEVIEENLSVFHMTSSAALRRHVLSTATITYDYNGSECFDSIERELDLNRPNFIEDAIGAIQGRDVGLDIDTDKYDEIAVDVAEQIFATAVAYVKKTLENDIEMWRELLRTVYDELWSAANGLKIISYLSDSDNVIFVGNSGGESVMVYGVIRLPDIHCQFTVGDLSVKEHKAKYDDFTGDHLSSALWSDDYVFTVNGKASHPDLYVPKMDDIIRLYEVSECKS